MFKQIMSFTAVCLLMTNGGVIGDLTGPPPQFDPPKNTIWLSVIRSPSASSLAYTMNIIHPFRPNYLFTGTWTISVRCSSQFGQIFKQLTLAAREKQRNPSLMVGVYTLHWASNSTTITQVHNSRRPPLSCVHIGGKSAP
jgi:hypothetical protein